jgi:hypothetical protein
MRLRLRIELQDDAQVALGTVTWTPAGGTFSGAAAIDSAFNRLQDVMNSFEMRRRVNMLRTLADQEISVTAPPNISIST